MWGQCDSRNEVFQLFYSSPTETFQKRWRKEKKARRKLQEQMEMGQSRYHLPSEDGNKADSENHGQRMVNGKYYNTSNFFKSVFFQFWYIIPIIRQLILPLIIWGIKNASVADLGFSKERNDSF